MHKQLTYPQIPVAAISNSFQQVGWIGYKIQISPIFGKDIRNFVIYHYEESISGDLVKPHQWRSYTRANQGLSPGNLIAQPW